jgi:hypothetical protein
MQAINALTYGGGVFVAAGGLGNLRTSTDAITWTARTSGTTAQINALTYGDGVFVAAGAAGNLLTSTDGITWDLRTSGTTSAINALLYADDLYVAAGDGGGIRTATKYTYDPATEFALPTITAPLTTETLSPAYIKAL